jgi:hypothetical protein
MRRKHLTELRAAARRSLATSLAFVSNIQLAAAERPASPAAHISKQTFKLTDESNATRGRVHAVVML